MAASIVKDLYLTNTQKEVLALKMKSRSCFGQLDTFDPYWNKRQGNDVFFYHYSLSAESMPTKSI